MSRFSEQALLIELLTEELPPKALPQLSQVFAQTIAKALADYGLRAVDADVVPFASPRRLAVILDHVQTCAPDVAKEEKIMPVAVAFDQDGKPTPALLKKLAARGFAQEVIAKFERRMDGKNESLFYPYLAKGAKLAEVLSDVLAQAVKKLPVPKVMRWGDSELSFVRPVHGLVCLHGKDIIPASVLGLQAGRETLGHRFLSAGKISFPDAASYPRLMHDEGRVLASFEARYEFIRRKLEESAAALGATLAADDALLNEVTALVEWPVILQASFDEAFLKVPQECLILTMKQNQKYFPLLNQDGQLIHHFLFVSNLASAAPKVIVSGNERVLRARLSDAQFFFEQDQKTPLMDRFDQLENVVYHNQLGSQKDRVLRLEKLASEIAQMLGVNAADAARAARLAKADLLSDMVGEFPELQGVMGMYYAKIDGEKPEIAEAIEAHYRPRFAGDALPKTALATSLALADKLETLAGIWGIGLIPTGEKDPFALRRHVLGVLRMILEGGYALNLKVLFDLAVSVFPADKLAKDTSAALYQFAKERLRHYLLQTWKADEVDAVLAGDNLDLARLPQQLAALRHFKAQDHAAEILALVKRVQNIVKKNAQNLPQNRHADPALLCEDAERHLFQGMQEMAAQVAAAGDDFAKIFAAYATLPELAARFFEEIMVMTDDLPLRENRLLMLRELAQILSQAGDLSLLADC